MGLLSKSEAFVRKCIDLCPNSRKGWNMLGVIAFVRDNYRLAQHAFIKSVKIANNSTAWVNLGALYTSLGCVVTFLATLVQIWQYFLFI